MSSARQEIARRRLLLVEEDRHTIDAMRDEFMEHGLECEVTLDMDTARGILHNRMMDVAVINARLPGVSDERLVKELAAINPDMLVVVYNGTGNKARQRRLRRLGADSYLSKSSDLNGVIRAVHKLLGLEH